MGFFVTASLLSFVFLLGFVLFRSNFTLKHWIGYGISTFVIAYGVYDVQTCDGKFCEFLGIFLVFIGSSFLLGYISSHVFSKLDKRAKIIIVSILLVGVLLVIAKPLYTWYQLRGLEKEFSELIEKTKQTSSVRESIDICKDLYDRTNKNMDKISSGSPQKYRFFTERLPNQCWMQAHINHEKQDICLELDDQDPNYKHCVAGQGLSLQDVCQISFFYEGLIDYQNFRNCLGNEHDHPTACLPEEEYQKLVQCWDDVSNTYTSSNTKAICSATSGEYSRYCVNYFGR